ncbi:MAG: DUF4910 domain-containing protein [Magnetococcales bacterium]|nr:DUF4910 domain-containing protein [Magnetococcales bacterium]
MTESDQITRWRNALQELWGLNRVHAGSEMAKAYRLLMDFYPSCQIIGYPSGDRCGSWVAPLAWEVNKARLLDPQGKVLCDWHEQKLSVFTYSPPFMGQVSRSELEEHLFSIPGQPERTPFHFRNQYRQWEQQWGFCLPHKIRENLPEGNYTVEMDTSLSPGMMEMVEQVHEGESTDSLLLIGHFDHPQMCNDGLVGCLAGHEAVSRLAGRRTHLTYRMLSTVEIVGSVFYAVREAKKRGVKEALFVATSGANAPLVYQSTFYGQATVDRLFRHVLRFAKPDTPVKPFRKGGLGNDEIAFDVQGVQIPCGSIMRAPFSEYHTDLDTPASVHTEQFEEMVDLISEVIEALECHYRLVPRFSGLPCLSSPELDLYLPYPMMSHVVRHGLTMDHPIFAGSQPDLVEKLFTERPDVFNDLMTALPRMCDGVNTVLDVAERVDLPFRIVERYTKMWEDKGLLERVWTSPFGS